VPAFVVADNPLGLSVSVAFGDGVPLVVEPAPSRERELDFGEAVFEVDAERNEG